MPERKFFIMANNHTIGNFYEKQDEKQSNQSPRNIVDFEDEQNRRLYGKRQTLSTSKKDPTPTIENAGNIMEYYNEPLKKPDITEIDEIIAKTTIDDTPLAKTNGDVLNRLIQWSDFNGYGNVFALMKIVPQKGKHHDKKIPWDTENNHEMNWKNKQDPGFMNLYDALHTLYKLETNDKYTIGMLVKPPFVFLDVDDIPNEISEPSERMKKIDELTNHTYSEVSISGAGAHFLFKIAEDVETPKSKKQGDYELYGEQRWVALTGDTFLGVKVKTLSASQLDSLTKYLWGDPQAYELDFKKPVSAQNEAIIKLDSQELIKKMKNSANGKKFTNLWEGGNDDYTHEDGSPDPSAGDQALCDLLAFWTGHDAKQMDLLFRQSPRFKERSKKWEEPHYTDEKTGKKETYGHHTIQQALKYTANNYTGSNAHSAKHLLDKDYDDDYLYMKFGSNAELLAQLTAAGQAWLNQNKDKKGKKPNHIPDNVIIDILCQVEQFRVIYSSEEIKDNKLPLYYYDWDLGIYKNKDEFIHTMIQAVDQTCTKQRNQKDIILSLKTNPRHRIPIVPDMRCFDHNSRRYVHVKNGIYDRRLHKLLPASPEFAFTSFIETKYDDSAFIEPEFNGWRFSHFLKQVALVEMPDGSLKFDPKKYRALWETMLCAILGATDVHKAVIFVDNGQGSTGKSTLLKIIKHIVGTNNTATLGFKDMPDPQNLAKAENKILIADDENETGLIIKYISALNKLITGETQSLKRLYQDRYDAVIHAFIIEASNAMPKFKNAKEAVYERFLAIKFNVRFAYEKDENKPVKDTYANSDELSEWILYHCLNDVHLGASLTETQESHQLLTASKADRDPLSGFLMYLKDKSQFLEDRIPTSAMYKLYCAYFFNSQLIRGNIDSLEEPMKQRSFTTMLRNDSMFSDLYSYAKSKKLPDWSVGGPTDCEIKRLTQKLSKAYTEKYNLLPSLTDQQIARYNSSCFELNHDWLFSNR